MPHIDAETPPPPPARISGGDSSPSSAEMSFRELDDVFLQTQTRIWLGEVLQTRLTEHGNIAEMLSDGELLFEVSRAIWEMVLTRRMELGHLKPFKYDPFASRKHSGRYAPYCNVDSFLKMCKILGLSGIDLFSPSDVVEKKNTRKVCMCIRLLSKKARSKCLHVPDFDIVTRTSSMSTDMVGFIRRSLELSQCGSSDSASYKSPRNVCITKGRQRHFLATSADSLSSEDIDDSNINVVQSDASCAFSEDVSYEDYQQDSPVLCKRSDANCRGEYEYEQNAWKPNGTHLDLTHQSVSEEDFWDSTTPELSFIPCQFGMSSTMNYESSADDAEGLTGSCASNLCSYEMNQTTGSENELRGKSHEEYLELSSVSSTNSVVGPLRLNFHDEHDAMDSFEDIQLPGIGNADAELGGYDFGIWSVQSDEEKVLLTEANISDAVDSELPSKSKQNDVSHFSSSVFKVTSSQVPSKSDEHLLQSEVTKYSTHRAKFNSCVETDESVSTAGDQFSQATDIDNETFDGSMPRSNIVLVKEGKLTPELLLLDDSSVLLKQEATCRCVNVGEKHGEVDGCNTNKGWDFVALPHMKESSSGSDNQHEETAEHRNQKPATHEDVNQENMKSRESDVMITQNLKDKNDLQPLVPADIKPPKRPLIKSIVRGTAVLSVMLLVLRFRKSGTGKIKESTPSLLGTNDQKQSTNTSSLPAQKRRIDGVQKGVYPAEKLKLGK